MKSLRYSLFFIILILSSLGFSQDQKDSSRQSHRYDSLWMIFNDENKPDTVRLKAIQNLAIAAQRNDPDSAIKLADLQIKFAQRSKQRRYEGSGITIKGISYKNKGNYQFAMDQYIKALQIFEEIKNRISIGDSYLNMGTIYQLQANFPKALELQLKALKIYEESKKRSAISNCFGCIANVYREQFNYTKALEYHNKNLQICEDLGNQKQLGVTYSNMAAVYLDLKNYPKALEYYSKSLKKAEENNERSGELSCYIGLGSIYQLQADHTKALNYFLSAIKLAREISDQQAIGVCYSNLAEMYNKTLNYNLSIQYSDSALKISEEIGDLDLTRFIYGLLSEVYSKEGEYKKAFQSHVKFKKLTDSIFNEENSIQLGDMKTKFEVEKKETELKIKAEAREALSAEEKKRQLFVIYSVAGLLILVIIFAGFMFNRYKVTQKQKTVIEKQKKIVEEQKIIVEQQKHLVEEHQKEIIDSITYAKRLQQAILPSNEELKKHLPESFLLYKPKDIVAGDFYWMEYLDETTYIAAADSTGHGVPGAMVSVVCSNAMNRAVKEFGLRETGKILDKTRELVLETFAKSGEEIKDGMDISLLAINGKHISWSGANNQLWYISNNELIEITADKQPIGKTDNPKPFTTHHIEFNKGDTFYLMTDGYPDQFGGPKGKKFKYKQLEEFLLSVDQFSLTKQKEQLNSKFEEWKGDLEQVDDVCVIGFRIN